MALHRGNFCSLHGTVSKICFKIIFRSNYSFFFFFSFILLSLFSAKIHFRRLNAVELWNFVQGGQANYFVCVVSCLSFTNSHQCPFYFFSFFYKFLFFNFCIFIFRFSHVVCCYLVAILSTL